ncbi:hypothetical protein VKT23_011176 [Stygiomarasmius scandens]|uniref:Uncharacterized protein n=1 Tax=Marasmiellus scandens TaxID=2682957 RepID=A0ABR1JAX1_9AGAR
MVQFSNLFLELDLKTKRRRRLSGTLDIPVKANLTCPGPRNSSIAWADKEKDRFYVWSSIADRDRRHNRSGNPHIGDESYSCDDFWRWDFKREVWRKERIEGNPSSPRGERGYTYNETSRLIVFGGFSPAYHSWFSDQQTTYQYCYHADTFIHGTFPSTASNKPPRYKWQQVLTFGFPVYRAYTQLMSDLDVFGGLYHWRFRIDGL